MMIIEQAEQQEDEEEGQGVSDNDDYKDHGGEDVRFHL